MDEGGNVFTTAYDGLDRVKTNAGPVVVSIYSYLAYPTNTLLTFVTNKLQQTVTSFYDVAGRAVTNLNALGEKSITLSDAIGRPVSAQTYSAASTLVHEAYFTYSTDHNSVTTTEGSGASEIVKTVYTDTQGHNVLSIANPSTGTLEFTRQAFDLAGNLVYQEHDSSASGVVSPLTTASYTYDGLNRLTSKIDRDSALTTYAYDAMGGLTNRTMSGVLQWQATNNNAGQIVQEKYVGGSSATRTNGYSYFSSSSAFAGLLQTKTDGRGVSCTYSYDDRLRATNFAYSGALPEQNLTTTLQYEPRNFITGIIEQFSSTNTGPATSIQRSYDPYGQLASESVNGGSSAYGSSQSWDAAGRRDQLSFGTAIYNFGWQADGNLTSASDPTGTGNYSFDTAGFLTSRTVGNRVTSIASRDGEGRPLIITNTVNLWPQLAETLTWSGDGLLATHTLNRGDFGTDSRAYSYANLSRRLTQEQLNLNAGTTWTNATVYDNGVPGKLGSLTKMGQAVGTSNTWSGFADAFSRVATETNSTSQYSAYGHVNGQSTLSAWLDNQPISVTGVGTNAMQWRAMMDLTPGMHQLLVAALHPSGFYTAWATNSFTNSMAYQSTADSFDSAGNITNRVWKDPGGTIERSQTLSWDARGRLHSVTDRDASNSGYNWTATYDGLSRRLSTTSVLVTNGVVYNSQASTINSYFDPLVEFLELGVSYGITTEWKLYGPSLNGKYGGMNGVGGLDAVSPYLNVFDPIISDFRGNILGVVTNGALSWNPARPAAYGAVPGYRPLPLGSGANVSMASAWRGKWADITGYYQLGLRPYDPISGRWLTYDSAKSERDPNAYTFCGGDSVNYFDSDGRCPNPSQQNGVSAASVFGSNSGNINVMTLLTWGMQNPNVTITGNDNASGWMAAGQAMANGTLANPQYVNGYQDQFGHTYMDFCMSCHDPNDPMAQLKLGAAFNTVNTSIPAFVAQNTLLLVPAEGIIGDAGAVVANTTAQFSQADVQAAIAQLEARGIVTTEVQSSIDPNQVIAIAQAMASGTFQNALMDTPVIMDPLSQAIIAGNHRMIAAEMTGFNLQINLIPDSATVTVPLSSVPLQTGRVNPPVLTP
jgi:RHS repeat-associated protein